MKDEIEYCFKARLDEGRDVNYKVVVAETEFKLARQLRVDIIGNETDLRTYYDEWCSDCAVRNTTADLVPVVEGENRLLCYSCLVDVDYRRVRMCDLDDSIGPDDYDDMDMDVPDDNWFGMSSEDLDELYERAGFSKRKVKTDEQVVMIWDPDFEMVVRTSNSQVVLCGKGRDVLEYLQKLCSVCGANPNKETTLPDFSRSSSIELSCCPKTGKGITRVCGIKI